MFKAKRIDSGVIDMFLAVDHNDTFQQTYFLIWKDGWRWRPAHKYVPPSVDLSTLKGINVRTKINEKEN